ncbi:hypothetical protein H6G80_16890 [Nostoc sp. FACHB-87]|uniref:hypothetical protein n=1 Tax=Nostocaceae TaxID=1162 RepID=UPI001686BA84|nr:MULTISPECIES: hypothetical protein [Nostocaceae]MBD2455752.1 hypothetical protein [Nostoc sp. FACHB-87]MBD2477383.1 hypothetical protein [Anabaena sp. FACHB-83]
MSRKVNSNSRRFGKLRTPALYLLAAIAILAAAFPKLYEIKTKAGINISGSYHAGTFLEKHTFGLFRCEWLYPYHCDRRNGKV